MTTEISSNSREHSGDHERQQRTQRRSDSREHSGDRERQQRTQRRSLATAENTAEITSDSREHSGDHVERYIVSETPQTDSETPQTHTESPQSTLRHRGDIRYTPRDIK